MYETNTSTIKRQTTLHQQYLNKLVTNSLTTTHSQVLKNERSAHCHSNDIPGLGFFVRDKISLIRSDVVANFKSFCRRHSSPQGAGVDFRQTVTRVFSNSLSKICLSSLFHRHWCQTWRLSHFCYKYMNTETWLYILNDTEKKTKDIIQDKK